MYIGLISIFLFFWVMPFLAFGSAIINEVLFKPVGNNDTGLEWVEIYNPSDTSQDLTGWELYPDGIGYFLFPAGFQLAQKSFVVVHLRAPGINSPTDLYYGSPTSNMGNISGSAALFSGEPRGKDSIKSFVEWGRAGETWESSASDAGLWIKDTFIDLSSFSDGSSIALVNDGINKGGKDAWGIFRTTTQGASNTTGSTSSNLLSASSTVQSQNQIQTQSQSVGSTYIASIPQIKAYAGEDKIAIAGAEVEFLGQAVGSAGEPLENARFWWNFGDGGDKEGRAVSHIFQIPGNYTVGLHISSGLSASSDYALIKVIPNQISISGVLLGGAGYVSLKNKSDYLLDIGEWTFEDEEGKRFFIPAKTKIGAGAEISFPNLATGLLKNMSGSNVSLFYPNGAVALKWEKQPLTEKVQTVQEIASRKNKMNEKIEHDISENQQKDSEQKSKAIAQISGSFLSGSKFFLFFSLVLGLAAGGGFLFFKKKSL